MNALTPKQQRILNAIREFQRTNGRMPTRQELATRLGYRSANTIQQYIVALEEKGYLEAEKHKSRGITLQARSETVNIPLVGTVACGSPILAEENIEAYISVDENLIPGNPAKFFFLSAHGDSMDLVGIEDQDLLLVESRPTANSGDTVLALISDEATVKTFKPERDYIALVPRSSNPSHRPIIMRSDFSIQGVVRRVIKQPRSDV